MRGDIKPVNHIGTGLIMRLAPEWKSEDPSRRGSLCEFLLD